MKYTTTLIILILWSLHLFSQDDAEVWDTYLATYEEGKPGSVTLRMDLIKTAPLERFSYVVVTGLSYETARADGLPEGDTFSSLHKVDEELLTIVNKFSSVLVGTFTYDYERLSYFYVKKIDHLEDQLRQYYKEYHPEKDYYLNIKQDSNWEYYLDFLYPNQETLNYMSDQSVVSALVNAGDKLEKKRRVDHWLYFQYRSQLLDFKAEVEAEGFYVTSVHTDIDLAMPYELKIWREDFVTIEAIYPITSQLRGLAKKHEGRYDGWETHVIK